MTYTLSISLRRMRPPSPPDEDATEEDKELAAAYEVQYEKLGMTHHQWRVGVLEVNAENPAESKVKTVLGVLFNPEDDYNKEMNLRDTLDFASCAIADRASQLIHHTAPAT